MNKQHWASIIGVVSSICVMGASLHTWQEATTPQFVFGAFGAVVSVLAGIFSDRPTKGE